MAGHNAKSFSKLKIFGRDDDGRLYASAWSDSDPRCILGDEYLFHYRRPSKISRLEQEDKIVVNVGNDVEFPCLVTDSAQLLPDHISRSEFSHTSHYTGSSATGSSVVGTCRLRPLQSAKIFDEFYRSDDHEFKISKKKKVEEEEL